MSLKLTHTQTAILKTAAKRADGKIEPLPPTLKGGARQKVIEGLDNRKLVVWQTDAWVMTDAGYTAVGCAHPVPDAKQRRSREGSKQAAILGLLAQQGGTTLAELMDATGWQAHSVRGTLSILGRTRPITSERSGNRRIYRLQA